VNTVLRSGVCPKTLKMLSSISNRASALSQKGLVAAFAYSRSTWETAMGASRVVDVVV